MAFQGFLFSPGEPAGRGALSPVPLALPAPLADLADRVEAVAKRSPSPQFEQVALFDEFAAVLEGIAAVHPVLLVVDDLQWADLGSVSLLFHLGRKLAGCRILIVGAYRPEEVAIGREVIVDVYARSVDRMRKGGVVLGDVDGLIITTAGIGVCRAGSTIRSATRAVPRVIAVSRPKDRVG